MRVIAAAETDAGICKPINQDGYCIKIAQTPAGQVALAAVCDGMGGLEKGELASATAVREFSAWFDQTLPGLLPELDWMRVSEMWRAMIHDVDVRLHEYGAAHGLELGTTVTAMLIYGGKYLIAHVGDTRVYEVGGVLRQLTEDHTVVEREVQAGLLTPEAAELDPGGLLMKYTVLYPRSETRSERVWINCAAILTAISAGVSLPISIPMGVITRASCCSL